MMKKIMMWIGRVLMEMATNVTVFFIGALVVNTIFDSMVSYSFCDGEYWFGGLSVAIYMVIRYQMTRLVKWMAKTKEKVA